ncbi:acetyl-CoA carboxylase biotin carboxylase subunit [Helicobacter sp. 12S02634-8]|uniref:acetyl-CoA carboxylase subunit A n=1 Tax=Helicobacter sp. 12S02634-8 TaxID=1476199 RepID=UPI000BA75C34|nr:acetyl-CoA carboxylase subunit A [Helicobacter sp. 12S02634-8]PAF48076.1 acetyl-CoA carboxylase biotin carboxylase subunit [Helicobacter sp. 12S02634-8]
MFTKILIANRGEIAVRIIRACNDLCVKSVGIYAEADKDCLHIKMAQEAYSVGKDPIKGYLDPELIIKIAKESGAQAIHPGYGFLSENADFARKVAQAGLVFIGPSAAVIAKMGDKNQARDLMQANGIPIVPGTQVLNQATHAQIKDFANQIGYPVILKASGGGGGRGIRTIYTESELIDGFEACKREAKAFFNNDDVFMEKYIQNPRHIEFQILADNYGNVIHLLERDCSIQRRHQKLIEIAPSPLLGDDLRCRMGAAAVRAAKVSGYSNAGTVEFLLDEDNRFYFMEMNTRIQVEHGITEEITGLDLIARQIRIASGELLELSQSDIKHQGFAIEARINAEDPYKDFTPNGGKITGYYPALGPFVRVDSCIYKDYTLPPFYDSMIAKVIVRASSYNLAVNKMVRALEEFKVEGIATTVAFLLAICKEKNFKRGDFDTSYLQTHSPHLLPQEVPDEVFEAVAMALCARYGQEQRENH